MLAYPYSYSNNFLFRNPCTWKSRNFWKKWYNSLERNYPSLKEGQEYFILKETGEVESCYDEEITDDYVSRVKRFGYDSSVLEDALKNKWPLGVHPNDPRILKIKQKALRIVYKDNFLDRIQYFWNYIWNYDEYNDSAFFAWMFAIACWLSFCFYY